MDRTGFQTPATVAGILPLAGFEKVLWQAPYVTLPPGMEIDFGGFAKEYAVDRALAIVGQRFDGAALVNFDGDLAANGGPSGAPWRIGVERPDTVQGARLLLELTRGALATSRDTRWFLLRGGVRYGYILDVITGWPVTNVPRSVSVAAATCVEAGMLATVAMLHGEEAEAFLDEQGARYWCPR
jgi:thiamine biosynthesis lipoprotein